MNNTISASSSNPNHPQSIFRQTSQPISSSNTNNPSNPSNPSNANNANNANLEGESEPMRMKKQNKQKRIRAQTLCMYNTQLNTPFHPPFHPPIRGLLL